MNIRTCICYELSLQKVQAPMERTVNYEVYQNWRQESLSRRWSAFDDDHISGKTILDFGCGDGELTLYLAKEKYPRSIVRVDVNRAAISRAREALSRMQVPDDIPVNFIPGETDALPLGDQTVDTVLAFDCLEHVMAPSAILRDWFRVIRPGGRCLIEWSPLRQALGPAYGSADPDTVGAYPVR